MHLFSNNKYIVKYKYMHVYACGYGMCTSLSRITKIHNFSSIPNTNKMFKFFLHLLSTALPEFS